MAPAKGAYRYVQDAVTKEIYSPGFQGSLPPLSEAAWAKILKVNEATRLENDRLEFVGDGLIAAVVSMECHRTLPQGSPGLYTQLKSALVANVTFYHLARNFSFCALKDLRLVQAFAAMVTSAGRSQKPSRTAIKKIADFFETIVAAYHSEAGFDKLCDWVGEFYPPLIRAAERGYHFFHATRGVPPITAQNETHKPRKPRWSDPYPARHNYPLRVLGPPLPVSTFAPFRTQAQGWPYPHPPVYNYSSSIPNLAGPSKPRARIASGPPHPSSRSFIDLTLLSDDEDEDEKPGHPTGNSKTSTTERGARRDASSLRRRRSPSVITISSDSEGGEDELDEDDEDSREVEVLLDAAL